ncbi:outer membrane protein [Aminobacter sp. UC22_36]|uniref:outer membrane protein n=1 Tax=Aminobacter sp. UC22_36 TaxID=3374549 RepID=UPI003758268E
MKTILLASTLLFAAAGSALAADVAVNEPAPEAMVAPAFNWAGGYAGVLGAGTLVHHKMDTGTEVTRNFWSPSLAVFGGYNWQSSNFVYGIDGELGYRFKNNTDTGVPGPGTMETKLGLYGALRGRVGVDMGDILPYLAVGVTATQLQTLFPGSGAERDASLFGGVVGVGADVKLTEKLFLRGEYAFSYYGSKTLEYCGGGCEMEHKVQTHDFKLGVAYKF